MTRLLRAALLTWLVLFAVAFANGALRALVLEPRLGAIGLPIAGISGMVLLGLIAGRFAWRTEPSVREALAVGGLWLVLTLAVEVALVVASGRPALVVADTFTFSAVARGELFAPMVLWMAAIPAAVAWWRG